MGETKISPFQLFRDKAGIAAAVLIVGWSGSQLHNLNETATKLSDALIELKTTQGFHSFRLDKQADKMIALEIRQNDIRQDVSRIQERLIGLKK